MINDLQPIVCVWITLPARLQLSDKIRLPYLSSDQSTPTTLLSIIIIQQYLQRGGDSEKRYVTRARLTTKLKLKNTCCQIARGKGETTAGRQWAVGSKPTALYQNYLSFNFANRVTIMLAIVTR